MSYGKFDPSVSDAGSLILGEGKVYVDYDEVGQALIGATSEGSSLDIERVIRPIPFDGSYGSTVGQKRYDSFIIKLTVNLIKVTTENMLYGLPATRTTSNTNKHGTYNELTFDLEIAAADVLTNITFVGQTWDGKAIRIKLLNALNLDNIEWEMKGKSEIVSPMIFTAFYEAATPSTPPLEVEMDESAA